MYSVYGIYIIYVLTTNELTTSLFKLTLSLMILFIPFVYLLFLHIIQHTTIYLLLVYWT